MTRPRHRRSAPAQKTGPLQGRRHHNFLRAPDRTGARSPEGACRGGADECGRGSGPGCRCRSGAAPAQERGAGAHPAGTQGRRSSAAAVVPCLAGRPTTLARAKHAVPAQALLGATLGGRPAHRFGRQSPCGRRPRAGQGRQRCPSGGWGATQRERARASPPHSFLRAVASRILHAPSHHHKTTPSLSINLYGRRALGARLPISRWTSSCTAAHPAERGEGGGCAHRCTSCRRGRRKRLLRGRQQDPELGACSAGDSWEVGEGFGRERAPIFEGGVVQSLAGIDPGRELEPPVARLTTAVDSAGPVGSEQIGSRPQTRRCRWKQRRGRRFFFLSSLCLLLGCSVCLVFVFMVSNVCITYLCLYLFTSSS